MQSDMGTAIGTHLDANFVALRDVLNATLTQLELIQRDDGDVRDSTVHSDAFTSDALALMAGSSGASTDLDWRPRGNWASATLYEPGNIVQTGAPAVAYVCVSEHVSTASFATDYANNRWVVLSSPRTLISADVISALSYTPVNIAGDTMQGALSLTTGSSLAGSDIHRHAAHAAGSRDGQQGPLLGLRVLGRRLHLRLCGERRARGGVGAHRWRSMLGAGPFGSSQHDVRRKLQRLRALRVLDRRFAESRSTCAASRRTTTRPSGA
jgi:hypothetical protein